MNAVDHYLRAVCLDPEDGETVVKAVNLMMANTVLFQAYKKLTGKQQQEVMAAIRDTNRVADLCENNSGLKAVCLKKFPAAFQQPLKNLFVYLGKMHCVPQNLMIIFRPGWKILLINLLLKIKVLKYVRFVLWKVFMICRGNPDEK